MSYTKDIIEFVFSAALFINALLFIPQAIRIYQKKNAFDVSLLTFVGFLLIQLTVILHGVLTHDTLLIIGYALSMLTCGTVVILTIYYRKKPTISPIDINLEDIIAQLPGHVYWKNKAGVSLGSNTNNWKDFGLKSIDDYIGKTDAELFSSADAAHLKKTDDEIMKTGQPKIVEELYSDGNPTLYLSHKAALRNHNNEIIGIIGNSLDITQVKKDTKERLNMLEKIIALMPGHVYWVDTQNVYLGCNDNQAKSAGLASRYDIIGKRNKDLPWNSNSHLPEELDATNLSVMHSGTTMTVEEPAILPDGRRARFLSTKVPMHDLANNIIGLVGISIDITERIEAIEREQFAIAAALEQKNHATAEAELRRAVTILAGSIAHDLRTPLTAMSIMIDLFKKAHAVLPNNLSLSPENSAQSNNNMQIHLENIDAFPAKMKKLVYDMSEFIDTTLKSIQRLVSGTLSYEDFIPCEIEECINEVLIKYPFNDDERKLVHLGAIDNFTFFCYPVLFYRILFNLLNNSLQQIKSNAKGEIFISTEQTDKANIVRFKDTAGGASPEIINQLFSGYKTTKKEGTGVGLAFCKLTMQSFDGDIVCHSVEGDYIEFILTFPRLDNGE